MSLIHRSVMAFLVVTLSISSLAGTVAHAQPASFLSMFRKKQQLAPSQLTLEAKHGPWLILAATLSGEDAETKAYALANEIRQSLRVPSFVMQKNSDDQDVLGVGQRIRTNQRSGELVQKKLKLRYANETGFEGYAVLAGEFSSTDDPRIQSTLRAIHEARPVTLHGKEDSKASSNKDDSAWLVQKTRSLFWWQSSRDENLKKGKMGAAFVTRNPLLPDEYFQNAPSADSFITELNKQVKHSLLDCPGRFTVRVASFYGQTATDFSGKNTKKISETSDALDKAAHNANKLTLALRAKGHEAYQFHDRYGSYVTVGSFEDIGRMDASGQFHYDQRMIAVMNEHCGYENLRNAHTGVVSQSLKTLEKIPFDAEGKPIAVPKPKANGIYSGSLLGRR